MTTKTRKPVRKMIYEAFTSSIGTAVSITFAAIAASDQPLLACLSGAVAVFCSIITCVKLVLIERRFQ